MKKIARSLLVICLIAMVKTAKDDDPSTIQIKDPVQPTVEPKNGDPSAEENVPLIARQPGDLLYTIIFEAELNNKKKKNILDFSGKKEIFSYVNKAGEYKGCLIGFFLTALRATNDSGTEAKTEKNLKSLISPKKSDPILVRILRGSDTESWIPEKDCNWETLSEEQRKKIKENYLAYLVPDHLELKSVVNPKILFQKPTFINPQSFVLFVPNLKGLNGVRLHVHDASVEEKDVTTPKETQERKLYSELKLGAYLTHLSFCRI